MRHPRTILLGLLMVVGILAVPTPAQADTYATWAIRACDNYPNTAGPAGHICLKVYVKRQEDGTGINLKNQHVYAWTTNQGGCGTAFRNPAADNGTVAAKNANGVILDGATGVVLADSNNCDRQWTQDVGIGTAGVSVTYYFTARLPLGGVDDELTVRWFTNGTFSCGSADSCDKSGPF